MEMNVSAICNSAPRPLTISRAELVTALSRALDMTEGQPAGHAVRCCWIGLAIGREAGLPQATLDSLYYAIILKDLGCSSNAARICQLYLTDDLKFKHDSKTMRDSLPNALSFVLSHTGLQVGLAQRFRAMFDVVRNGHSIVQELIETRCGRGERIARDMHFSDEVAVGIRDLDEHWDGGGRPARLRGDSISVLARIALIAQVADVFHTAAGSDAACAEVMLRSGTWFDPSLATAFVRACRANGFWQMLRSPDLESALCDLTSDRQADIVDDAYLDDIATAFAQVVDAKSPFTAGHSLRVSRYADTIARHMGWDDGRRRWLRRAGLLHDIGKLGVSNQVLDKPGKLDETEWRAIRAHPGDGETILARVGAFVEMSAMAGAHHERLDGGGYPRGLVAAQISDETRVLTAADVFDALTAKRPYRGPISGRETIAIMARDIGTAFDPRCVAALEQALYQKTIIDE
jgi:HD-GYP domain-containing protein (c-di-GMP phosphodiesterase class II)